MTSRKIQPGTSVCRAALMFLYLLAVRFFEEARKLAPEAPVIYLNLGLAESRIPGRELRAIAWFGAYLAANPTAPNAAAVKEQIAVLDVKTKATFPALSSRCRMRPTKYHAKGIWAMWRGCGRNPVILMQP